MTNLTTAGPAGFRRFENAIWTQIQWVSSAQPDYPHFAKTPDRATPIVPRRQNANLARSLCDELGAQGESALHFSSMRIRCCDSTFWCSFQSAAVGATNEFPILRT
jgi:hypothetical protein